MKHYILLLIFLSNIIYSQKVFKEKIGPCVTDRFTLEGHSPLAKCENETLLKIFSDKIEKSILDKLKGKLYLQIIVDTDGNSCLMSITNETNLGKDEINIIAIVNEQIKWTNTEGTKLCPLILLSFEKESITVKRLGYVFGTGWREFNSYAIKR